MDWRWSEIGAYPALAFGKRETGAGNMSDFSIGAAVRAGFELTRTKPLSVFGWGLFYIIVAILPLLAIMGAMLPQMLAEVQAHAAATAAAGGVATTPPPLMQPNSGSNLLMQLWSIIVRSIVSAAVFRAVLEPRKRAFAYLRLGMQEVWIFLVSLVKILLVLVGIVAAVLVAVLVGGGIGMVSKPAGVLVGILLAVVFAVGLVWAMLRLSLATVMSFDESGFRLTQSWNLTKGRSFDLFMIALLLIDFVVLFELFAVVVCIGLFGVFAGINFSSQAAIEAFAHQPPQAMIQTLAPFAVLFAIVAVFLFGIAQAIFIAPWAAAYRMLKPAATTA
jgi:hypothetical protein